MINQAQIRIKKIVVGDEELFEIVEFINICTEEDVPREYLLSEPAFVVSDNELRIYGGHAIPIGQQLTKSEITNLQKYLKLAGNRLIEINHKLAKRKGNHSGEYIFTV